tara:strand:- start:1542 stop:2918 length:1377 start_codon:yes stop_codon:yes gene_type:complete
MDVPKPPKIPFLRKALKPLWEYLHRTHLLFGPGINHSEAFPAGTLVSVDESVAAPFAPLTPYSLLQDDAGQYTVKFRDGHVYQGYPSAATAPVTEYDVYIGANHLGEDPAPSLEVSTGDYIYLRFDTDEKGKIKQLAAPGTRYAEIVALGAAQDSTYHVPPNSSGTGTDGTYYILLGQVDAGPPVTITKNGWRGNFFWNQGYDTNKNVGSGIKLFKEYDIANEQNEFKTLIERTSNPQINISASGSDEVKIEGNNKSNSIIFNDCDSAEVGRIEWVDGLVTTASGATVTVGNCSSGSSFAPQFQCTQGSAANKIAINQGFANYLSGTDTPLVSSPVQCSSTEVTATAAGGVWASFSWQVYQHSENSVYDTYGAYYYAGQYYYLRNYRNTSVGFNGFSFRTSAPSAGWNSYNNFTYGIAWYYIASVNWNSSTSTASVGTQYIEGTIHLPEFNDSTLSTT